MPFRIEHSSYKRFIKIEKFAHPIRTRQFQISEFARRNERSELQTRKWNGKNKNRKKTRIVEKKSEFRRRDFKAVVCWPPRENCIERVHLTAFYARENRQTEW